VKFFVSGKRLVSTNIPWQSTNCRLRRHFVYKLQLKYKKHYWVIKGTRAQNCGLKSTYLKYNLDMSLSQEMSCCVSESQINYDNILKKMKNP